ncbi:MAG: hypothetical protein R3C53_10325 [Pirellulaceae bacterium]
MMHGDNSSSLNDFFTGLSEYVFHSQLGVVDTELVDYISQLLIRFTRVEGLQRVRLLDGKQATEVVAMVAEAEQRLGEAKREVHRHIGDYTLFWSGLYPEALRQLKSRYSADQFVDYCAQGKRAYRIASTLGSGERSTPSELLQRMSDQFEMCAYGLREIRREWERRDDDGASDVPLVL